MSNYTISDGTLLTKAGNIKLDEVDYLVPRKGLLLKQYIFIGSRNGSYVKVRVSDREIEHIFSELRAANAPLFENLESVMEFNGAAESLKKGKSKRINENTVWLTDATVLYVPKRKILATDDNPVCINIKDVVFSTTQGSRKFGIIPSGYSTYFGSAFDQAVFKHPQKKHGEKLNQFLVDNGSAIGKEASTTFKDCFWFGKLKSPFSFCKHEEIGIADDAVIYKFKKGSSVESVFLPFDKISYINMRTGAFHSNKIQIWGQQNIITHLEFSNEAIKALKEILIQKAIPVAEKIIRPRTLFGLFPNPFAKRTLAVFSDKLVFSDTKSKSGITLPIENVEAIVWRKKLPFYLIGYLFVDGEIENIRMDQSGGGETIEMPKIWFSQKKYIKKLAPGARYNKRDDKKTHKIEYIKYS